MKKQITLPEIAVVGFTNAMELNEIELNALREEVRINLDNIFYIPITGQHWDTFEVQPKYICAEIKYV